MWYELSMRATCVISVLALPTDECTPPPTVCTVGSDVSTRMTPAPTATLPMLSSQNRKKRVDIAHPSQSASPFITGRDASAALRRRRKPIASAAATPESINRPAASTPSTFSVPPATSALECVATAEAWRATMQQMEGETNKQRNCVGL
uniref:Secreted protein n=1 Tax=Steinernema glaseri TaxID=37863 RepID=A0A1I8A488_9BILA